MPWYMGSMGSFNYQSTVQHRNLDLGSPFCLVPLVRMILPDRPASSHMSPPSDNLLTRFLPYFRRRSAVSSRVSNSLLAAFQYHRRFSGVVVMRSFLGFVERSAFPGCFCVISMRYKRSEAQKRFTCSLRQWALPRLLVG